MAEVDHLEHRLRKHGDGLAQDQRVGQPLAHDVAHCRIVADRAAIG